MLTPSGSYLVVDDGIKTTEGSEDGHGLELVEPGVVPAIQWRPEPGHIPGAGAE